MKYKTELTNNFHNNSTFFDDQRGIATMYDDFEDDLLFTPEQMLEIEEELLFLLMVLIYSMQHYN